MTLHFVRSVEGRSSLFWIVPAFLIAALRAAVSPSQIARLIRAIVVGAIKRQAVWARSEVAIHPCGEGLVIVYPRTVDRDSTSAVSFIRRVLWVKTTLLNVTPQFVELSPSLSMCSPAWFGAQNIASQATTRLGLSGPKSTEIKIHDATTRASALNAAHHGSANSPRFDLFDHCQTIEDFAWLNNYLPMRLTHMASATGGVASAKARQQDLCSRAALALAFKLPMALCGTRKVPWFSLFDDSQESEHGAVRNVHALAHKHTNYLTKQAVV